MRLLNILKGNNKEEDVNYATINSRVKAESLYKKNLLKPLYLMPLQFNGQLVQENTLYVPDFVVPIKNSYDDMVEVLVMENKVTGYKCNAAYKGDSFIPSALTIVASKDGKTVFEEKINIW